MSTAQLWEKDHGYQADGHQRKEACLAIAACPVCGKDVELIADTESWVETEEGSNRWQHDSYGPAQGVCCFHLIVDSFNGFEVYRLPDKCEMDIQADSEDTMWSCGCGNLVESALCCPDCGSEPPWGCDCGNHGGDCDWAEEWDDYDYLDEDFIP